MKNNNHNSIKALVRVPQGGIPILIFKYILFWEKPQSPIYSNKNPLVQSILVPVDIETSESQDHNWQWPNCKRAPHFITICGDKSSSPG